MQQLTNPLNDNCLLDQAINYHLMRRPSFLCVWQSSKLMTMKMTMKMMTNNDDDGKVRQRRGFLRVLSEQRTPYVGSCLPGRLLMMHQPSKYEVLNISFNEEYTLTRSLEVLWILGGVPFGPL